MPTHSSRSTGVWRDHGLFMMGVWIVAFAYIRIFSVPETGGWDGSCPSPP
jgi:hypothetical protein